MTSSLVCIHSGPMSVSICSNGPPSFIGDGKPAPCSIVRGAARRITACPLERATSLIRDISEDSLSVRRPLHHRDQTGYADLRLDLVTQLPAVEDSYLARRLPDD